MLLCVPKDIQKSANRTEGTHAKQQRREYSVHACVADM